VERASLRGTKDKVVLSTTSAHHHHNKAKPKVDREVVAVLKVVNPRTGEWHIMKMVP
jgi:hypothetical protein